MKILEVNRNTLANLYELYPESLKGLSMDGNDLVYNGEHCDISEFNINDLLNGDTNFSASLSVLSAEDIFKIIRLHAITLNGSLANEQSMENDEVKAEIIKQENPLMRNISIIKRREDGFEKEYVNIVDSNGIDHIFRNDRDVNIFNIYEWLKVHNPGREITPDELIDEVNRKLPEVGLTNAITLLDSSRVSEDFANKMRSVYEQFKDDKTIQVFGNEEDDMVVIRDLTDSTKHRVVTFEQNEHGQLVSQIQGQNVLGTDTVTTTGDNTEIDTSSGVDEAAETEKEIIENNQSNVIATLIPTQEFYDLLNSQKELNEQERRNVDLYYAYFGDLILYEDYLLPELKTILNTFREYVFDVQFGPLPEGQERIITQNQQEAIEKAEAMELKVATVEPEVNDPEKAMETVRILRKTMPENNYNGTNTGSISVLQVLAVIIGVSIILTAITLYLIG